MRLVELTEFLVKNLVKQPDMISVKQLEEAEDTITIQVLVNESVMGMLIGKAGATANAIRTIVQASSYITEQKKVRINIDSF